MKSAPVIIVQLIHIEGPMKGEIQDFSEPEISIGRHPSCQVQFPKDLTTISRKHAMIVRDGNRFKMVNQGPNGTFVNGKRLDEVYLKDGDVLTISENGPKVSFLTEMKEGEEILSPVPPQQPESEPVMVERAPAPPAQPEPPAPAARVETPVRPPQPAPPKAPVQRKPAAHPPQQEPPATRKPATRQPRPEAPSPKAQGRPAASPSRQKPAAPQEVPIQRVQVPLIIQLGPTLRSYKELPVTLGKSPACDFVLNDPAIIDHHAQLFFSQDQYWVKDLTGQQAVSINGRPIGIQASLNPDDSLELTASGPRFRFLGGGRLAEIEEPLPEEQFQDGPPGDPNEDRAAFSTKDKADKVIKGAKNVFDKFLKR